MLLLVWRQIAALYSAMVLDPGVLYFPGRSQLHWTLQAHGYHTERDSNERPRHWYPRLQTALIQLRRPGDIKNHVYQAKTPHSCTIPPSIIEL